MASYLEHANMTVRNLEEAVHFLQTAMPEMRVRGGGTDDDGRTWLHIGTDESYVALEEARSEIQDGRETYTHPGFNHLGFVVEDAEAVRTRLRQAGYREGFQPVPHPHRKRVYFHDKDGTEYEFVQYLSLETEERNSYED